MAELLKGAAVAAAITEDLLARSAALRSRGIVPTLAILRVGAREADLAYERGAKSRCAKANIAVRDFLLPDGCTREALLGAIRTINEDASIHGCLMFRPLPNREDEAAACALLDPKKDVDAMTRASLASLLGGGVGFAPCTAQACLELLDFYGIAARGKRVVVVGRSLVIGKPVALLLLDRDATVTICHTKTENLAEECRRADIVIAAAGRRGVLGEKHLRAGQIVLDVGVNTDEDGKLCGDVDFAAAEPIVAAITPVPGGVGSVTSSVLAKHVIEAAEKM